MYKLEEIKEAVKEIKDHFYEGNDSHSHAEYHGACQSLDMLIYKLTYIALKKISKENK